MFVSVLDRYGANISVAVEIQQCVVIEVFGLSNLGGTKFNVKRVRVLKGFDLHGVNDRSKNVLCTVSPSGHRITRKYFPPVSLIGAHRRIRPSF